MGKKTKTVGWALVMLCYSVALAGVSGWIGYKVASGRVEDAAPAARPQTFYATVSDIRDNAVTVTGMEVNDINFRGEFCFSVTEETEITWRYTDISLGDLEAGDNVSITFTGEVMETSPAQIQGVEMIQLLDDEK
ncbi:MAG: DUF3221 domain-containing protein [Lachnospiraceae bacterium]|nr:DUF3221 domain-containing protein [Lachnospiraceae bacterium]